jgi:hypothetical protein
MSALKFDVLDLIREPDNYTSGERAQVADAFSKLREEAQSTVNDHDAGVVWGVQIERLRAALACFGGEA